MAWINIILTESSALRAFQSISNGVLTWMLAEYFIFQKQIFLKKHFPKMVELISDVRL